MSDYFAGLAVRTLRPELGVQPRHRARWEGAAPAALEAWTSERESSEANAIVRVERSESTGSAREDARQRRPPRNVDRRATPPATRPLRHQSDPGEAHTDPIEIRGGPSRIVSQRVAPRAPAADPGPGRGPVPVIPQPPGTSHRPAEVRSKASDRAPIPARPTLPSAGRSGRDRESSHSEPSIRIHIGRVEVRAIAAPGANRPSPRARPQAPMSLDEYAQQRDREAR